MAAEITIQAISIDEAAGLLNVELDDGVGWQINWPPPEGAEEDIRRSAEGIIPDFIRLLAFQLGEQSQSLVGAKVVLDFTRLDALVRVEFAE